MVFWGDRHSCDSSPITADPRWFFFSGQLTHISKVRQIQTPISYLNGKFLGLFSQERGATGAFVMRNGKWQACSFAQVGQVL